ncbi:hypothetical protein BJ912DRAFT_1065931 [Pholiota molesta]|nr:hypothetical protein BJ912DRAFT_1065931 [Pholiota molesta]
MNVVAYSTLSNMPLSEAEKRESHRLSCAKYYQKQKVALRRKSRIRMKKLRASNVSPADSEDVVKSPNHTAPTKSRIRTKKLGACSKSAAAFEDNVNGSKHTAPTSVNHQKRSGKMGGIKKTLISEASPERSRAVFSSPQPADVIGHLPSNSESQVHSPSQSCSSESRSSEDISYGDQHHIREHSPPPTFDGLSAVEFRAQRDSRWAEIRKDNITEEELDEWLREYCEDKEQDDDNLSLPVASDSDAD